MDGHTTTTGLYRASMALRGKKRSNIGHNVIPKIQPQTDRQTNTQTHSSHYSATSTGSGRRNENENTSRASAAYVSTLRRVINLKHGQSAAGGFAAERQLLSRAVGAGAQQQMRAASRR